MVKTTEKDGICTISAEGELDRSDRTELIGQFKRVFSMGECRRIDLDFRQVSFMDSTCAKLVSDLTQRLRRDHKSYRVWPSPQVRKTFQLLGGAGLRSA